MKKSILIMFLAAIFLAGCIGGNGDFDPMPEEAIAEVPEVEEDLESWGEETEPESELVPLSVSANGFNRRIECGGDISAVVEAKNAVGSVVWEITGLPSWAQAKQSGDANSVVTIAGAFPFESCDETSNDVKFKACDEEGRCKETTLKLKTKIPVVSINAKLPDLVVPYGNTVELKLKAKGGSGEYGWTTIVPASLAGADSGSSDEVAISGDAVSFTAKGVGSHEVEVFVEDAALGSQRAELEKKYADKDRMLMRDSA
ncbi:MAG TPA: hypothetical protein PLZ86_02210, partial [bacterium]|nr:hypothetical protein [bacterium]